MRQWSSQLWAFPLIRSSFWFFRGLLALWLWLKEFKFQVPKLPNPCSEISLVLHPIYQRYRYKFIGESALNRTDWFHDEFCQWSSTCHTLLCNWEQFYKPYLFWACWQLRSCRNEQECRLKYRMVHYRLCQFEWRLWFLWINRQMESWNGTLGRIIFFGELQIFCKFQRSLMKLSGIRLSSGQYKSQYLQQSLE